MYIYDVAKSLGFSFRQEKNKSKPKALASCADGNEKFPCLRTTLSRDVVINSLNKKLASKKSINMSNIKQMERIGIGLIIVAAICFICEVLEIEFLNSFTQYGSYLFAIGVVFWVSGYFTRKKEEKNKK